MNIKHNQDKEGGRFSALENERKQGYLTYKIETAEKILIDHTYVKEEHRKKGVGSKLVKAAIDFARENNLLIIPQCPFAEAEFQENSEYQDVLAK